MKVIRSASQYRGPKIQFIEITGGYALWAASPQSGFENTRNPLFGSLEYGNTLSPISYGIGTIVNANFQKDSISLQNQHAFMYGKYRYQLNTGIQSMAIELYLIAGVQGWRSSLDNNNTDQTEFSIPGGQEDAGFGMLAGSGLQLRYKNLGLGCQFLWLSGKGTYLLADQSEVGVLTGSKQVNVALSYRIFWGHKKVRCPIYSK